MREFKFRAWDSDKMSPNDVGVVDGKAVDFDGEDLWYWHEQPEVIMQFTGLKDKNGVEIYEGDLYRQKGCMYPIEVYYDDRHAGFRGRVNGEMQIDKTYPLMWHKQWEVIGNIYENPELQDVKK